MICLLLGSFNPIHWGHIALGRYAYEVLSCREVWFVLSPLNPQKKATDLLAYTERKTLIEQQVLLLYDYMKLCEIERDLPYPLYSWRTIQALRLLYPKERFVLLIGSDNLINIRSWARWQYLLGLIELYVYPRPGYIVKEEDFGDIVYTLCAKAKQYDISSTEIRQKQQLSAVSE